MFFFTAPTFQHLRAHLLARAGADPWLFLGGGAPLRNGVTTFFLDNTSCIRKPQVISEGWGGGAPLHPPPRSAHGEVIFAFTQVIVRMSLRIKTGTTCYKRYWHRTPCLYLGFWAANLRERTRSLYAITTSYNGILMLQQLYKQGNELIERLVPASTLLKCFDRPFNLITSNLTIKHAADLHPPEMYFHGTLITCSCIV